MSEYFKYHNLLKPPVKRAAFSDRTAYLMAEMSRLAYFRFEGGSNLQEVLNSVESIIPDKAQYEKIKAILKNTMVGNSPEEAKQALSHILKAIGYELVDTFVDVSTDAQAFLCKKTGENIAILAFRGTEPKLKDIKADVKASLIRVAYGKDDSKTVEIHAGYYGQFAALESDIQGYLRGELAGFQVFITGHSLGGALAITATKFLCSDSTGACYTFGSPPVGTNRFDEDIKTPIYRIINHVDIVPRLPNPYLIGGLRLLSFVVEFMLAPMAKIFTRILETGWYQKASKFVVDAGRFRQPGYGSYLVGSGSNVALRYNVMFYDKALWWIKQCKNVFRGETEIISDHSIDLYADMLATWANKRSK